MRDVWNKDPAAWEALTLDERLEAMRKWHCTGPSGQCAASMNTRETLNRTIREVLKSSMVFVPPEKYESGKVLEKWLAMLEDRMDGYRTQASICEDLQDYREGGKYRIKAEALQELVNEMRKLVNASV